MGIVSKLEKIDSFCQLVVNKVQRGAISSVG
jgi:hypothetical protein